jgi:hypothetical protein
MTSNGETRPVQVFCSHFPGKPNCCDSCHEDELEGYDTLWQTEWLHICCSMMRWLDEQGVDYLDDESAVRSMLAGHPSR